MSKFFYRTGTMEGGPTIQPFVISAAVAEGDLVKVNPANGQVAPATTNATGLLVGLCVGPANYRTSMTALVNGTSKVNVITDLDAVYGIVDANARKQGQTLDISGGTGAQALAASSSKDFVVAAESAADQETLVRISAVKHFSHAA